MNKKSAIVTAGGLAASFVAGIAAVSNNWGLGSAKPVVNAVGPPAPHNVKPIIRHRRIVVHKKAPAPKGPSSSAAPRTVTVPQPVQATSPPVVSTSGSHAGGESDGGERGDD